SFSILLFNATTTTETYTPSLHDALPISLKTAMIRGNHSVHLLIGKLFEYQPKHIIKLYSTPKYCKLASISPLITPYDLSSTQKQDRKSTRLNSSHVKISYAVFCLKKKKQ